MEKKLENISDGIWKLENEKKGSALFFMTERSSIRENILDQIGSLTEEKAFDFPIAVLSEAHRKSNIKSPSGSIMASSTHIVPEAMDAAPNCGMRIIKTDIREEELDDIKIKKLFVVLAKFIPTGGLYGKIITKKMVDDILLKGSQAVAENIKLATKNEIENTYENGNFFRNKKHTRLSNPLDAIPKIISWIGKLRLNLLGATKSHFLYLAKVSKIEDQEKADLLGLKLGQYVFFMHTGSSVVGRYTASIYSPKKIKSFLQRTIISIIKATSSKKIKASLPSKTSSEGLLAISGESDEGKMTVAALCAAGNYGFANRAIITQSLSLALEKFFNRKIKTDLLYDAPHVFLSCESQNGKDLWIHRNGANRAFGPMLMADHPIFSKTGEPVLVAPFEGNPGYIGVGTNENTRAFFSANHEIGKSKDLSISREHFGKHSKNIALEMEKNKLLKIVAEVEPIEVLTY